MPNTKIAALNLADCWLAARASCYADLMRGAEWVFGRRWPWMSGLCRSIQRRCEPHLADFQRGELAALILHHEGFVSAFSQGSPPHILRYCITAAPPPQRPDWLPAHLPELASSQALADWLRITPSELIWFAALWRQDQSAPHPLQHYFYRWQPKRHGGVRLIEIPKGRLRDIQQQILSQLLNLVPPHQAAHGFCRHRSSLSHAQQHCGQAMVVRMDLRDFFPSIAASRVHATFERLGYRAEIARLLTGLCTHAPSPHWLQSSSTRRQLNFAQRQQLRNRHLPQGAPSSPALANLCAFRLDLRLQALADQMAIRYSRYADDLVFSGNADFARCAKRLVTQVMVIALEEGFNINPHKTRLMPAAQQQKVTGLVVNQHPNLPRSQFEQLKAILHNSIQQGPHSQNREHHPDFRAHLQGQIAYINMVNPQRGAKLAALFKQINWS